MNSTHNEYIWQLMLTWIPNGGWKGIFAAVTNHQLDLPVKENEKAELGGAHDRQEDLVLLINIFKLIHTC